MPLLACVGSCATICGKIDVLDDRATDLVAGDADAVLEELRDRERRAGAGELVLVLGDHHVARAAADVDGRDAQLAGELPSFGTCP